jgi:hypothetical protein
MAKQEADIDIVKINQGTLTCRVVGMTPLIFNAQSRKVKCGLLLPHKKTAAEKASTLKHDPPQEFRSSVYRRDSGPTVLCFPASAFKNGMASSAIDLGGAKKAQLMRLTWVTGENVAIYGTPRLKMDVVRSADMNRTPDIRTRAILPEWCCEITITYVKPMVNETVVANLLAAAGLIRGIGDFRQEKGAGNYGQFELVGGDDLRYARIVKAGGRVAQLAALEDPVCYDQESEEILAWWRSEVKRRGQEPTSAPVAKSKKAKIQ